MKIIKFSALVLAAAALSPLSAAADALHQLSFVMAHKPDNQDNIALLEGFAERVKARTGGEVEIMLQYPEQTGSEFENAHRRAVMDVYLGSKDMTQASVKHFGRFSPAVEVLDMPMLFRSHEHAARVLDGDIGQKLRDTVVAESHGRIKGLSFTYSGGFRNIYSTQDISSVSDLTTQKMRLKGGRLSQDAMADLGVNFVPTLAGNDFSGPWVEMHKTGEITSEEAETLRIYSYKTGGSPVMDTIKTVLQTNHSLYLTMVSINGERFATLKPEHQQVLQEEAQILAVQERDLSIRQEVQYQAELEADGIKFVSMTADDKKLLNAMGEKVHARNQPYLGEWMDAIKAVTPPADVQESKLAPAAQPL
jgi:TRAP-type C4-dicarboxylate transport system substrate-binding protein